MALKYVLSETGIGLRRNVSMSIALIVTLFVSLTLVGMGLLLNAQASRTESTWGSMLQIRVDLCNQNSQGPNCDKANVTPTQKTASDCWPHTITGSKTFHSSPGQSFGRKRMTMITITAKWMKR